MLNEEYIMDLHEYIKGAIETESVIEKLSLNKNYVNLLFKLFVLNSEVLDGLKKEVYYGKATKANEETIKLLSQMEAVILEAKYAFSSKDNHDTNITVRPRLFHGILGVATEAGELIEALNDNFNGEELDAVNVQEEMGDVDWYQAIIHDDLQLDPNVTLDRNLKKLEARNKGKKFSAEHTNNRDLETERKILEGNAALDDFMGEDQ